MRPIGPTQTATCVREGYLCGDRNGRPLGRVLTREPFANVVYVTVRCLARIETLVEGTVECIHLRDDGRFPLQLVLATYYEREGAIVL